MGKRVNLSSYIKTPTKRELKKSLFLTIAIGLIWFLVIMLPWLFWLKPYKEFGYYESEAVYNKNIFIVDAEHMRILYEIDGVEYEKTILFHTTRYAMNEVSFYYQLDNPYYTVDMRDTLLIVFPCVASAGFLLCGWAIWNYMNTMKSIKDEKLKSK